MPHRIELTWDFPIAECSAICLWAS